MTSLTPVLSGTCPARVLHTAGSTVITAHTSTVITAHTRTVITAHTSTVITAHTRTVITAHTSTVITAHTITVITTDTAGPSRRWAPITPFSSRCRHQHITTGRGWKTGGASTTCMCAAQTQGSGLGFNSGLNASTFSEQPIHDRQTPSSNDPRSTDTLAEVSTLHQSHRSAHGAGKRREQISHFPRVNPVCAAGDSPAAGRAQVTGLTPAVD
ncbi:hypothetical protein ACOMHN_001300 [Nucella lapillus]